MPGQLALWGSQAMRHLGAPIALLLFLAQPLLSIAVAQDSLRAVSASSLSAGSKFTEKSGAELFSNICQGCHMPEGKGAAGAGLYPSLENDKNLEAAGYAIHVVVNGQRAMPPVGNLMSDEQVAAVVNYVRSHFGNAYRDEVTAMDIKDARP